MALKQLVYRFTVATDIQKDYITAVIEPWLKSDVHIRKTSEKHNDKGI